MALLISRPVRPVSGRVLWGASAMELALLVLVLFGLFWQFRGLADSADTLSDKRYRFDRAMQAGPVSGFGQARLATLCHGVELPARLRWRWSSLCSGTRAEDANDPQTTGQALEADFQALQRALVAGEASRKVRIAPFAQSMAEGVLPDKDQEVLTSTLQSLADYREHYRMETDANGQSTGSLPLQCAWTELASRATKAVGEDAVILLANRLAVVTGQGGRLWWPRNPDNPVFGQQWSADALPECKSLGTPLRVISNGADVARQVHHGARLAAKSVAMERMQSRAPLLLAGWAMLSWLLLGLLRRTRRPLRYLSLALLAWGLAGAVSGLVIPATGQPVPLLFWGSLVGGALLLGILGRIDMFERMALWSPIPPQANVLLISLPLFVLCLGIGWWLTFDLSLNGHLRNRYIALAQALPVFGGIMLLTVMPALAPGLARIWITWASFVTNALRPAGRGALGGWLRPLLISGAYIVAIVGLAVVTRNWRQLTGDAFRWWLLLGVSWFFMLRAARWMQPAGGWRWLAVSMLPLMVHVVAVLLALFVTEDLGPILVVVLSGGAYAGGLLAQHRLDRGAAWLAAAGAGVLAALISMAVTVGVLYGSAQLPFTPQRVIERIQSVTEPFSAENDQLAHVFWFRDHLPARGYGFGNVPWCGTLPAETCQGMPAQTQSDYTFTALQGVFGPAGAYALLAVYLVWLSALAARQAALTRGTLDTAQPHVGESAWLAWVAVCWVVLTVIQALVTVAGNLGALPLTGVTWPLLSFGTWSTLGAAGFLGLIMHRMEASS